MSGFTAGDNATVLSSPFHLELKPISPCSARQPLTTVAMGTRSQKNETGLLSASLTEPDVWDAMQSHVCSYKHYYLVYCTIQQPAEVEHLFVDTVNAFCFRFLSSVTVFCNYLIYKSEITVIQK